jgi:predicted nucleotidyltransferase
MSEEFEQETKTVEERAELALRYLACTDEKHARAKALLGALQEHRKAVKAAVYIEQINTSKVAQGYAEQAAYASKEYAEIIDKIEEAEINYMLLNNKRKRAELTIELFRTHSANQRRGNM